MFACPSSPKKWPRGLKKKGIWKEVASLAANKTDNKNAYAFSSPWGPIKSELLGVGLALIFFKVSCGEAWRASLKPLDPLLGHHRYHWGGHKDTGNIQLSRKECKALTDLLPGLPHSPISAFPNILQNLKTGSNWGKQQFGHEIQIKCQKYSK